MGSSRDSRATPATSEVRRIICRFIPEHSRLSGTFSPDHLKSLADEMGVKSLLARPLAGVQDQHPGVDAMLVPLTEGYVVVVNENASHTRQRYSLAHELGHIMLLATEPSLLRHTNPARYRSSTLVDKGRKAEERFCDAIAAELLMPEKVFAVEVEKSGRSLERLPRLANLFGASLTATAIRYWELLPEPCHLIRWKSSTRRAGVIAPAWQMRNKVPGPYLQPILESSRASSNEFRTLREAWNTLRRSASRESLLVKYAVAGKHYLQTMTFETETIGFGSQTNRAALSAVYLDRTC